MSGRILYGLYADQFDGVPWDALDNETQRRWNEVAASLEWYEEDEE